MTKERRRAIPESRDRLQSRVLVWVAGSTLAAALLLLLLSMRVGEPDSIGRIASGVSLTFAVLVWRLRAATGMAAICGGMVCLVMMAGTAMSTGSAWRSALAPLMTLFVLTFSATRAGRAKKASLGVAEPKTGRNAAQVLANLGMGGLVAELCLLSRFGFYSGARFIQSAVLTLVLAALCEATADTVSSEIGQAFGGRPVLVSTLRRVPPGTDGAMSLLGTAAGVLAAAVVAGVGMAAMRMTLRQSAVALAGGIAGLFFDSVLGATVERRGWLGNDLVNFSSTAFAVVFALLVLVLTGR